MRESTDDAEVDGHVIPISARINGTIIEVLVNDNQVVKAGQPLVRLDPADYQVAQAQAEASLGKRPGQHNGIERERSVNQYQHRIANKHQLDRRWIERQAAVDSAQQAVNSRPC